MFSKLIQTAKKTCLHPLKYAFNFSFEQKTIGNFFYFKFSTIDKHAIEQLQKETANTTKIAYYHLYFDQNVQGFEKISPAANQIRQHVQAKIKVKLQKLSNRIGQENQQKAEQSKEIDIANSRNDKISNNESQNQKLVQERQKLNENQLKDIIQEAIQLMTEEISIQAKHIFDFMNQSGKNKKYEGKKITSIWEIRKMIEREILWTWSKQQILENQEIIKEVYQKFLEIYENYVANILQTIVKQGKNIRQQYFELKENPQNFKSIGECVLENISSLLQKRSKNKENEEDPALKKSQNYFYEGLQAKFKPTSNMYWQNNLQNEQPLFKQMETTPQKNFNLGIVFIPTYYTYQVIIRVFKEYQYKYHLHIKFFDKSYDARYRYLQGLKSHGMSTSVILARDLFSYLMCGKIMTIPNIQIKQLKQFINLLCAAVTRDLWRYLSQKRMKEVYQIWKQNNSDQQIDKNQSMHQISNGIGNMMSNIGGNMNIYINEKDIQLSKIVKDSINTDYKSVVLLGKMMKIVKQLKIDRILIDQFDYFGRKIYELFNIKDKKSDEFNYNLVQISKRFYFASLLFEWNRYMCLFAQTSNYQYLKLIKILVYFISDRHTQKKIFYLHYGRQMAKKVVEFLNIYVFYQKSTSVIKKQVINSLINGELLFKTLLNLDVAFSLGECEDIAKRIYKLFKSNIDGTEKINQINEKLVQIVSSVTNNMKKQVQLSVQQNLYKFIDQKKFQFDQTCKFLQTLIQIYQNIKNKNAMFPQKRQNYFGIINNLIQLNDSQKISVSVNENRIFHQGYKQIFKGFFQKNNMKQLLNKLFPKYQSLDQGQMIQQICKKKMKKLIKQKNKNKKQQQFSKDQQLSKKQILEKALNIVMDHLSQEKKKNLIKKFQRTIYKLQEIVSQNLFGQYFQNKSKIGIDLQSKFQFKFNQILAGSKNSIEIKNFKFSRVVYSSDRLKQKQIFELLRNKATQKIETDVLYVFRTAHLPTQMSYILFFAQNETVYILFTYVGVSQFDSIFFISKHFWNSYKVQIEQLKILLQKNKLKPVLKHLIISTQGSQQKIKEKFEEQKRNGNQKEENKKGQNSNYKSKNILDQVNFSLMQNFFVNQKEAKVFLSWRKRTNQIDQIISSKDRQKQ